MKVEDFTRELWRAGGSMERFTRANLMRPCKRVEEMGLKELIESTTDAADVLLWAFDWVEHKELGEDCPVYRYWEQVCFNLDRNREGVE